MLEKVPVRLPLIDLAAGSRYQAWVSEVSLKFAVVRAEGACPTDPGEGDHVAVIRDAEIRGGDQGRLSLDIRLRDQASPSGSEQRP